MKILHLMLACFYIDNYTYQENLLPKYHKKMGHDVKIVASMISFDDKGRAKEYEGVMAYTNENDIPVQRLKYRNPIKVFKLLRSYKGITEEIDSFSPDLIFIHGCQFVDAGVIKKYAKNHRNIKIVVDNHADFNNSAKNWVSLNVFHKIIWRYCASLLEPYTSKFYGVLPARVDFLKDIYNLPPEKCELLVLGADDEEVIRASTPTIRNKKRSEYGLTQTQVCILAGGKIDHNKPQIINLMKAVNILSSDNIILLVFGSVTPELECQFNNEISDHVVYIGWKKAEEIYDCFAMADIIAFPGLHSVLWEQAVGMGKPCLFKRIEGFEHIDLGGNCLFFEEDTIEEYTRVILKSIDNYDSLKEDAQKKGKTVFSYQSIAHKSIMV